MKSLSPPTWQPGFTTPDNPSLPILDRGIRPQPDFADTRNDPDRSLPMAVAERVKDAQDEDPNIKVLFTANSFGALQRVQRLWRDASGASEPVNVESCKWLRHWKAGQLPPRAATKSWLSAWHATVGPDC